VADQGDNLRRRRAGWLVGSARCWLPGSGLMDLLTPQGHPGGANITRGDE
jgi:hypothetical protein